MKFGDILKSACTNLMRNKGRTILTIVAIFIGSFTIALTNGVNIGVNDYIDKQVSGVGGDDMMLISPKATVSMGNTDEPQKYDPEKKTSTMSQNATLNDKDVETIKEMDGMKDADSVKSYSINYISGASDEKYVFSSMPILGSLEVDLEAGKSVNQESKDFEINLAPEFVKSLGYKSAEDAVGKTVKLSTTASATGEETIVEAKIVGVRNQSLMQGGNSLLNQALIDELSAIGEQGLPESMLGQYGMVVATMDKATYSSDKEIADLKERLGEAGYAGQTVDDEIGMIRNIINAITGVLTMFGAIALLAASFGIVNTLFMSVQERTREIGLMKAMGLSSGKVFSIFSIEAALIGFLGSVLGILGAAGVGNLVNGIASDSFLSSLTGFTLIQFSWSSSGAIILIIMAIAFLAGTLPARRAAKLDPIESLRYE
ncbi:ABC transporter permease [Isobaculum melis]|uniref:Putative ABC transport system permease protein n=1 Tax=Isobaculum melis TaxID=142588 RepID=A0A1H9UI41_9LACT|nr:ABC transporter permease [Isobaculum melis]SES08911.1 putative ABC transport system permease protein [Isobaculum melis]